MTVQAGQDTGEGGLPEIWYRLDPYDRVIDTGGAGWHLAGDNLKGTCLYDHVAGHFTKRFLKDFLRRARLARQLTRQCYRCDTPETKRLMEMCAVMESPDVLRVDHRTLGSRALMYPVHFREVPRPKARNLRCSGCNRLRCKGNETWREPDDAVKSGEAALVVHTVCPDCRRGIDLRRQSSVFRIGDLENPPQRSR